MLGSTPRDNGTYAANEEARQQARVCHVLLHTVDEPSELIQLVQLVRIGTLVLERICGAARQVALCIQYLEAGHHDR